MHSMKIKRELPEVPPLNRDYKKRPRQVDGWGKYIKVLPCEYKPKNPPIPKRMPKAKPKPIPQRTRIAQYVPREHPRHEWTDERVNEVIRLYLADVPFAKIGEKMDCSEHAAYMVVYKARKQGKVKHRKGSQQWTREQVETLVEMYCDGATYDDIAKAVDKSRTTVYSRVVKMIVDEDLEPREERTWGEKKKQSE